MAAAMPALAAPAAKPVPKPASPVKSAAQPAPALRLADFELGAELSASLNGLERFVPGMAGGAVRLGADLGPSVPLRFEAGLWYAGGWPAGTLVAGIHDIGIGIGLAVPIPLAAGLRLEPGLGYGLDCHLLVPGDWRGTGGQVRPFLDQFLQVRVRVLWQPVSGLNIYAGPACRLLFEASSLPILLGGELGLRISL